MTRVTGDVPLGAVAGQWHTPAQAGRHRLCSSERPFQTLAPGLQ